MDEELSEAEPQLMALKTADSSAFLSKKALAVFSYCIGFVGNT